MCVCSIERHAYTSDSQCKRERGMHRWECESDGQLRETTVTDSQCESDKHENNTSDRSACESDKCEND